MVKRRAEKKPKEQPELVDLDVVEWTDPFSETSYGWAIVGREAPLTEEQAEKLVLLCHFAAERLARAEEIGERHGFEKNLIADFAEIFKRS